MSEIPLHCGDCRKWNSPKFDAIVSDPPYGCENNCNYDRFSGGISESRNFGRPLQGDINFDPSWMIHGKKKIIIFGFQFFSQKLPPGTILIWLKKRDNQFGTFLSDCELAWMSGGKGCYVYRHIWHGFDRQSEKGRKTLHPTQKPAQLLRWCIRKLKLKPGSTIYDPYMGSGSTGVAAIQLGYKFIGAEIDEKYFEIAKRRIESATSAKSA